MSTSRVHVDLTQEALGLLTRAAAARGQTLAEFVTTAALESAQDLLDGLQLTRDEAAAFVSASESETPMGGALAHGAARYRSEFDEQGRRRFSPPDEEP